jgi:predicted permease
MKKDNKYIIIGIIIIIFIILFWLYFRIREEEHFSNNSIGFIFETGVSNISSTGSVKFNTPFKNIPMVFTQINGTSGTSTYLFSINVFDITTSGFNYAKIHVLIGCITQPPLA